ncbi:receptor-like protein kinase FERONIA [Bidens hawaiensis]|uniref:receptor-like protein kinase FERONIA n=1 Tax=Bidens hawaiensis TaxID=980011 RepID=UPI0040498B3F
MMPRTALDFYKSHISPPDEICRRFSLSEIQFSTQAFDDRLVIGRGSFGKVYKCTIYHRFETIVVAVKRLNFLSSQGAPEFWAEVEMLGKLHHCNLVSLIGYCNEKQEMVLVYEYMKHGTLEDQLHKAEYSPSWLQRLGICIDAAHGLNYLHTGTNTQHGVIHRDVKTSNILLDENFRAKISDFGLAKTSPTNQAHSCVSTQVKGTFGYIDPAYFYTGKLTRKSDVYAFGVVLLEVLCGRPAVDATLDEEQWGLAAWALDFIRKGKPNQIIDPRIRGQISPNCVKEFARVAISCLHDDPKSRPTMVEVVAKLVFILSLQERMGDLNSNTTFIKKVRSLFGCNDYMKCNSWTLVDDDGSDSESIEEDIELLNTPVPVDADNLKQEQDDSVPLIRFDATSFFTMADLLRAPAENISRTGYSSIYRVRLDDGHHLMVKRLIKKFFNKTFEIQVSVHGKIRHKNIMPLQACYNHKSEALLIYTSSENGTLASFLNG